MRRILLALPLALVASLGCQDNETPPPSKPPYVGTEPAALPCVPNLDGKIEAGELAPAIGIPVTYLVSPAGKERTVDLAGHPDASGKTVWDLGVDYADDQAAQIEAQTLDKKWYAPSFASVTNAFVAPIDAGDRTEGVYTNDEHGIYLHGIASATESPPEGKTLLVYGTPIVIYQFPLAPGATWSTTSEVKDATLRGLPYAGRDTYEMKVDASGQLGLPDFILTQAMRVHTKVTIAPAAGELTTQRQTSFVFECLGEVARATSKLNEPDEGFSVASELRRLGLAH